MTKAQEVRSRRLAKRSEGITAEAEKIFSWILDLMDADTERGYYGSLEILLYDDDTAIVREAFDGTKYDATGAIFEYGKYSLFEELEAIVNREDGFEGKLTLHDKCFGKKFIRFKVVIK